MTPKTPRTNLWGLITLRCRRCGGRLVLVTDKYGRHTDCLTCGEHIDVEKPAPYKKEKHLPKLPVRTSRSDSLPEVEGFEWVGIGGGEKAHLHRQSGSMEVILCRWVEGASLHHEVAGMEPCKSCLKHVSEEV